ncbi:Uncharacterised protein [Escherichia coli]|uniref:Uncharacterized protein n=1 Tax=Escherichia coli TaxID=562 RepID=A0A376RDW7_ECOLX|nr:Uncharacterised protein [Escherichia coli]
MVTWTQMYMPMGGLGAIRSGRPDPDNILLRCTRGITSERTCRWSNNPYLIYPDCDIRL